MIGRRQLALACALLPLLGGGAGAVELRLPGLAAERADLPVAALSFDEKSHDWVHRGSGLRFPYHLAGYRRTRSESRAGTDVEVVYEHGKHEPMRVRVYRADISADWLTDRLDGHFRELLPEVAKRHPEVKILVQSRVQVPGADGQLWEGRRATVWFDEGGEDLGEVLDVFLVGEEFVAFRTTVRGRRNVGALTAILQVLQVFPWPSHGS